MRIRQLSGTDVQVTDLAFGAAGIGNLYHPIGEEDALATVDAAWDTGIRTFDTAPHYGLGLSERRLGAALRGKPRSAYAVSTKVGRLLVPDDAEGDGLANGFAVPATHRRVWDFSADGVLRSLEASLNRLGLDHVDIVLLHDPDAHARQALTEAYPALERLRDEGVVRAIGIGMNQCALPTASCVRPTSTSSCSPAATPSWNRRPSSNSCPRQPPAARASSSEASSTPGCSSTPSPARRTTTPPHRRPYWHELCG